MALGDILQALTTATGGIAEGLNQRKKLESQALREELARRLQEAQIQNFQSEIKRRADQTAIEQGKPKAPVMGSPEWVKAQADAARARAGATQGVKQAVTLTPNEKRAARQVARALREMRTLYQKDKTSAQTPVASAVATGLGKLPLVGGAVSGLTGPASQRAMTANQQAFQRAATTLRHHYAMISPHARVTLGLLHDINTALVPPAGTDPAAIDSAFAPEWDYTLSQIEPVAGVDESEPSQPRAPQVAVPVTPHAPRRVDPAKFFKP